MNPMSLPVASALFLKIVAVNRSRRRPLMIARLPELYAMNLFSQRRTDRIQEKGVKPCERIANRMDKLGLLANEDTRTRFNLALAATWQELLLEKKLDLPGKLA